MSVFVAMSVMSLLDFGFSGSFSSGLLSAWGRHVVGYTSKGLKSLWWGACDGPPYLVLYALCDTPFSISHGRSVPVMLTAWTGSPYPRVE